MSVQIKQELMFEMNRNLFPERWRSGLEGITFYLSKTKGRKKCPGKESE